MIQLRHNQTKPVELAIQFIQDKAKNKRKPVIVAPTGAGKSLYIAAIADAIPNAILVLQPNKELLMQNYEKYIAFGNKASICSASLKTREIGHVTFATPGSIKNNVAEFKALKVVVIIDECDRANPTGGVLHTFLKALGDIKILGLTATPVMLLQQMEGAVLKMLNRTNSSFWNEILHVTQIRDIIKDGFWAKHKYMPMPVDTSSLKFNTSGSEYTEASIMEMYESNDLTNIIALHLAELKQIKKHIIVFCPSVQTARDLQAIVSNSTVVWGDMHDKDRAIAINGFKAGEYQVMINVFVLSIGFDFPGIDCIIDATPTASIARRYQKLGRGVRLFEDKECWFIEYTDGYEKFGELADLSFEDHPVLGWQMFSGDVLLSNIPVSKIGKVTKQNFRTIRWFMDTLPKSKQSTNVTPLFIGTSSTDYLKTYTFTFGKFKGSTIKQVPLWYLEFILKEFDDTPDNYRLKENIKIYLQYSEPKDI